MPPAHRHGDPRVCGATTTVIGQGTVTVGGQLWAVLDDTNTHGNGQLNNSGTTVTINGKPVIVHAADTARPDNLCPIPGGPHCQPDTAGGAASVFCY